MRRCFSCGLAPELGPLLHTESVLFVNDGKSEIAEDLRVLRNGSDSLMVMLFCTIRQIQTLYAVRLIGFVILHIGGQVRTDLPNTILS